MAEYIELEIAFNAITDLAGKAPTRSAYEAVWKSARALKKIPAADVAPVVHGRWKKSGSLLECQYCGEIYSQLGGNAGKSWNYCPNCGAKMDGVAENG